MKLLDWLLTLALLSALCQCRRLHFESSCIPAAECPQLVDVDLSSLTPCKHKDGIPHYRCRQRKSVHRQRPIFSDCEDCHLGNKCPETAQLLEEKRFRLLVREFDMCGFEGRMPKFCCPSLVPRSSLGELSMKNETEESNEVLIVSTTAPKTSTATTALPRTKLDTWKPYRECGQPPPSSFVRIKGGSDAGDHEFPWNIALVYRKSTEASAVLCGGALISNTEALTAAHCITSHDGYLLSSIKIGHSSLKQAMEVNLTAVTVHPGYTRAPFIVNDIALLHFHPLNLSSSIYPLCLPAEGADYVEPIVSGWGVTNKEKFPDRLQKLGLSLLANEECKSEYRDRYPGFTLEESQLCARGKMIGADSCHGDSGSSLQALDGSTSNAVVLGLTSFGNRNCDSEVPGVYTRVSAYRDWIRMSVERARERLGILTQTS